MMGVENILICPTALHSLGHFLWGGFGAVNLLPEAVVTGMGAILRALLEAGAQSGQVSLNGKSQ